MGLDERFPERITVPLNRDSAGFIGRECPACKVYFKLTPGTGLTGIGHSFCPYCGAKEDSNSFATEDQIEHAKSVVLNQVSSMLLRNLKGIADNFSSPRDGFLRITMEVSGQPTEVYSYTEKDLETTVDCANCTLRYAVYGFFAYCPDCGSHNSLQILEKNLELAQRMLGVLESMDQEVAQAIHDAALTQIVAAFDAFGREITRQFDQQLDNTKPSVASFQNISKARERTIEAFQYDFAEAVRPDEWITVCRLFQKRHLLAHKLGVVDDEYLKATDDPRAIVGRKVKIFPDEIPTVITVIGKIGTRMTSVLATHRPEG